MTRNRIQLLLFCILAPLGIFFWYLEATDTTITELVSPPTVVRIGTVALTVELAVTPEERIRGLSGRNEIGADGLLFIFPESADHGIWMKDMHFPIDIIWIGDDLTVVHIERNVHPETYPKVFRPRVPARYVLETESHVADTFGFAVGQSVVIPGRILE
jgi:uncharacterized membrane protein (UPF0127 family)